MNNRVYADYFVGNDASAKVLNKSGMKNEGISKQKYLKNDLYIDSIQCAIIASDYNR